MKPAAQRLLTARLCLDRLTEADAPLTLAIWNDPAFIRFVGDRGIRSEADSRTALREGALRLWTERGLGPYRVSVTTSGEAIGICGLFQRDNIDGPDIGYGFLPAYGGQGYALEAARAVRDHARDAMGLPRLAAIVSPDNARSIHLLEKLGMTREGPIRMPGEDEDVMLYGIRFEVRDTQ